MPEANEVPEAAALVALPEGLLERRTALYVMLQRATGSELAETYRGAVAELTKLLKQASEHQEVLRMVEYILADRMHELKATSLPTGDPKFRVRIERGNRLEPTRDERLLKEKLEAFSVFGEKLPPEVIEKVVYLEEPKPPKLVSDLTELNKLVTTYGEPMKKIKEACITPRYGAPKLIVEVE